MDKAEKLVQQLFSGNVLEAALAREIIESASKQPAFTNEEQQLIALAGYVLCSVSDTNSVPEADTVLSLVKQLVEVARPLLTGIDQTTKPYEAGISIGFGTTSLAIAALLRLLGSQHVRERSADGPRVASLASQVILLLAPLWDKHKSAPTPLNSSFYLHLDEPWIYHGLLPFLWAVASRNNDACDEALKSVVPTLGKLQTHCIEHAGTVTLSLSLVYLMGYYLSSGLRNLIGVDKFDEYKADLGQKQIHLADGLKNLDGLVKSPRHDLSDAAIWIDCIINASAANQPKFDYDQQDFKNSDELTTALGKAILREPTDEDDEVEETLKQLKRKDALVVQHLLVKRMGWCFAQFSPTVHRHHSELLQDFLYAAALVGDTAAMKLVYRVLGDAIKPMIEAPDEHDYTSTVVHKAARRETCGELAAFLVNTFKANVSVERSRGGMGAMHIAASRNCRQLIVDLVKLGGDPNVTAPNGVHTPIHRALVCGCADAAHALLDCGANPNITNSDGDTPLRLAVHRSVLSATKRLIEMKVDIGQQNHIRSTAIHSSKSAEVTELLINAGADIEAKDSEGDSPLAFAAMSGVVEVAEVLLKHGARVNSHNNALYTPLHWASQEGHLNMVNMLVKAGANVNAADALGVQPIHRAAECKNGGHEVMRSLIKAGASVHTLAEGWLPIHFAVARATTEETKCLLDLGADINAVTGRARSPILIALDCKRADQALFLIENGARVQEAAPKGATPLILAAMKGLTQVVQAILNRPEADPNSVDVEGWSALHWAAQETNVDIVKLLLANKANVNLAASDGVTPIHQVFSGGGEVARALLDGGASMNVRDLNGFLPLHYSVGSPVEPESTEVVQVLLERGCEVEDRILWAAIKDKESMPKTELLVKSKRFTDEQLNVATVKALDKDFPELAAVAAAGMADPKVYIQGPTSVESVPTFALMCPTLRTLELSVREDDPDFDPKKLEAMLCQLIGQKHPALTRVVINYGKPSHVPLQLELDSQETLFRALLSNYHLTHLSFVASDKQLIAPHISSCVHRNLCLLERPSSGLKIQLIQLLQSADSTGDFELVCKSDKGTHKAKIHRFIAQSRFPALVAGALASHTLSLEAFKALVWFLYSDAVCPRLDLVPHMHMEWFASTQLAWTASATPAEQAATADRITTELRTLSNALKWRTLTEACEPLASKTDANTLGEELWALAKSQSDHGAFDFVIETMDDEHQNVCEIKCHKALLNTRWPWFAHMMQVKLREYTQNRLNLTNAASELGLSRAFVNLLLEYFYTGNVEQFNDVDIDHTDVSSADAPEPSGLAPLVAYFGFNQTPELAAIHRNLIAKFLATPL